MPASTTRVTVPIASRPYDVIVGTRILENLGEQIAPMFGAGKRAFLIYDAGLPDELVVGASRSLAHNGFTVSAASIAASETAKTLGTAARILVDLAETRHERNEPVVALGGGVTGDVAGFVAATYRRGVPWIQCPTTLLSMVDASVGGKTGVNLLTHAGLEKNLVGAFWQPRLVVADVSALDTLPEREFRAGLAECVKHGLISAETDGGASDPDLFRWMVSSLPAIRERSNEALSALIARNVAVKARVVASDEREESPAGALSRALLNLGHTFAHAIETIPDLSPDGGVESAPLRHGEAVALGLVAAAAAGRAAGVTEAGVNDAVLNALEGAGLPTSVAGLPPTADVIARMKRDKKVASGRLRLILPTTLGRAVVSTDPPVDAVAAGVEAIRARA